MSYYTTLNFDTSRGVALWVSFDERRFLQGGAGVHRLAMAVQVDARGSLPAGTPVSLTGAAWLTASGRDYLGQWTTENPIALYEQPFSSALILDLTDDQLAAIEQRRATNGGGFGIDLDVYAVLTAGLPEPTPTATRRRWWRSQRGAAQRSSTAWPKAHSTHNVYFTPGQWTEMLAAINAYTSITIVAPLPVLDHTAHLVSKHLREAVRLIVGGDAPQGVTEARRAIEALDAVYGTPDRGKKATRQIADINPEERTMAQRLALLEHALYSLASPAAHGDAHASTFAWNHEQAKLVVASVAALTACRTDLQL